MFQSNFDLRPYNTFGISVIAENFAKFSTIDELKQLLEASKSQPRLILGGGSNILLKNNVPGFVLKNDLKGIEVVNQDEKNVLVKAGAGEIWHDFVLWSLDQNLGGIENLSLIPGSVGAAPMQNIGAYGVEIKDVFDSLEAVDVESGELKVFTSQDCEFGYRESVFKRNLKGKYIITSVTLRLNRRHQLNTSYGAIEQKLQEKGITDPSIRDVSNAVIEIRQSKLPDPAKIGNSGSFFKNPVISKAQFEALKAKYPDVANYPVDEENVKVAAGWLIDQAGWKGKTYDNYGVHKNQALVLVNYGGAKGEDIYQLSEDILQAVKEKYGITLEREVNVVG